LISLIADIYRPGSTPLDLGVGSGLIEKQLFARVARAEVVGVDASPAMLDLAKQRLAAFEDRCTLIQHDFAEITELTLPAKAYQLVMSMQTLHYLPHQEQRVFSNSLLICSRPAASLC
jgi:tRNA (cmo5U34)-methyltransferase